MSELSKAELSKGEQRNVKSRFSLKIDRRIATGILLVVLGTVCFAAKSIFIKLAYEKGATPGATLLLRQLIATPLFWILFVFN
jgi:drug/metabolite transporter (DMT)-like permease